MNRNLMNNNEQVEVVDAIPAVSAPAEPAMVSGIAPAKLTLAQVQARLDGKSGKRFWKNLDELAETPAFHELMQEEFPRQSMGSSSEWVDAVSRRGFLKVMGASMALAGLAGCTKQPDEPIFPSSSSLRISSSASRCSSRPHTPSPPVRFPSW